MSVNRLGWVAGYVSIHPTEGGQLHHRPAFWPVDGPARILDDLHGGWGEGVDINSNGQILIRSHAGSSVGAWLWDGENAVQIERPSSECKSFWPIHLTEDDAIIGFTTGTNGQRALVVRGLDSTWETILPPLAERHFTAANSKRLVAGHDEIDDFNVPWVKLENEEVAYLPYFQFHHHRPMMISNNGWIVGTATADNCCHPLLWVPNVAVPETFQGQAARST